MDEQWKLVEKHPNYQVSSLGRVRNTRNGHILTGYLTGARWARYPTVRLDKKSHYVHRLVAECFLGPIPEGKQVNHIDCNKLNPIFTNLEYVSASWNVKYGYLRGRKGMMGEKHPMAKLTEQQVACIRALYVPRRYGQRQLAREFGVSQRAIWAVVNNRCWTVA